MTNTVWTKWLKRLRNLPRRSRAQNRTARKDVRSRLAVESLEDRSVPAVVPVTPAIGPLTLTNNDFTVLQAAIGSAANGDTIDIQGAYNWNETFASASYVASTNTSTTGDIRGIRLPNGVNNLTITSSTNNAHIIGLGDLSDPVFDAFLFANDSSTATGNNNLIVEKLNIDDFEAGVTLGWNATGVFNDTKIRDNTITLGGDNEGTQNIALYFWIGTNQQVTNNTINYQGDGTRIVGSGARSFGFQNATSGGTGYDGLLIANNVLQLAASSTGVEIVNGIWENGHNDDNTSDISITNNRFLGRQGIDAFDRALLLSSQTTGLVIDGNQFTDVDNVFYASSSQGHTAGDRFTFANNILTRVGGGDGIFIQNVTNNITPIHVIINWNINNTIDGFTGVRGLNELSTQATGSPRPTGAATDLSAVNAVGTVTTAVVDDTFAATGRFTDPDGIGAGVGPVAVSFNDFTTIQAGINAVASAGTVQVAAGTYDISAGVTINKQLTLAGAKQGVSGTDASRGTGESILTGPVSTSQGAFNINTTAAVTINGFTINTTRIASGQPAAGDLRFLDNVFNLQANSAPGGTNLILSNPLRFTLTDNDFTTTGSSASAVIQVAGNYAGGADTTNFMDITGNTFTGIADVNGSTLQLNFSNVQGNVQNNTFDGVDIGVLVANNTGNLTIDGNTFKNITRGATEIATGSFGAGVVFFNPTLSGPVTITNNTFQTSDAGIRTSFGGGGPFTLNDSTVGITGNTFTGNLYDIVDKFAGTLTPAGNNVFDGVTLSTASTAQLFAIADKIVDAIDVSGYGLVRLRAGNVYVTPNSFFAPDGTTTPSIQRGIGAAINGDTVNVAAGSYTGGADTTAVGKGITLSAGSGPGQVTVNGNFTLDSNDTLSADINGSTAGTGYDQLIVNGAVTLGGATLTATGTRSANAGAVLVLIKNDGTDAINGTFQGRPEGSTVVVNGVNYLISYTYNAEAATIGNGNDVVLVDSTVTVVVPPSVTPGVTAGARRYATGSTFGGLLRVFDNGSPTPTFQVFPYPGFLGGISVAVGDVSGDGVADFASIIASGGPSLVRVYDGVTGGERLSFFAYDPAFTFGASLAIGDLNGDGRAEIIVGTAALPAVGVYDGLTGALVSTFLAYPGVAVGVRVAAGDIDGDGKAEIITSPTGLAPLINIFDIGGHLLGSFFAFSPAIAPVGLTIGAADLDGDGRSEIVAGASAFGTSFVLVYNSDATQRAVFVVPTLPTTISAFGPPVTGCDINGDGRDELLVTVGPFVGAFDGTTLGVTNIFTPYPGFTGGVFVG